MENHRLVNHDVILRHEGDDRETLPAVATNPQVLAIIAKAAAEGSLPDNGTMQHIVKSMGDSNCDMRFEVINDIILGKAKTIVRRRWVFERGESQHQR